MRRIVLIFCQIAVCVIHENAANPSAHSRARRSSDADQNPHTEVSTDVQMFYRIPIRYNDTRYSVYGNISIGNPPQNISVDFDTGSSDILIPIVDYQDRTSTCDSDGTYHYSQSTSYVRVGGIIEMTYGSAIDYVLRTQDRITIGDLVIGDHTVGETNQMFDINHGNSHKGLFGLGLRDSILSSDNKTAIDRLKDQNMIKKRIFCIYSNKTTEGTLEVGELVIGGCNFEAQYREKVVPVRNSWTIKMPSIKINNTVVQFEKVWDATIDTGSASTRGPFDEIKKINDLLGAKRFEETMFYVIIDCKRENLLEIEVKFGAFKIVLKPDDYMEFREEDNNGKKETACVSRFAAYDPEFAAITNDFDKFTIGYNILKKIVTIYDKEEKEIGFAYYS